MISIEQMLGKPYGMDLQGQSRRYVCWNFCRDIYSLFGLRLQLQHRRGLTRITDPVVPCIVLFRAAADWHSGVVWPDGLHFIHASPRDIFDPKPTEYVVLKDRLTAWPYNLLIEGFYDQGDASVTENQNAAVTCKK